MVSFFVYNFFKAGFFDILKETQGKKISKKKKVRKLNISQTKIIFCSPKAHNLIDLALNFRVF